MKSHFFTLFIVALICLGAKADAQERLFRRKDYLEAMEKRLSEEETRLLRMIYAPVVVGVPPQNARSYVCVMPDGEIRAYGVKYATEEHPEGIEVYLSSTDCGLTWKEHFSTGMMQSATYFPKYGLWVKCCNGVAGEGTYVMTSAIGPDDLSPSRIKVSDGTYQNAFLPQKSETSGRIFFTAQLVDVPEHPAAFFYSDDGCKSFNCVLVHQKDQHHIAYPDKGVRWSVGCGTEPYVCQLDSGKMMMLIRNSTNNFYQSFSDDEGTTWSEPEPSPFNGTDTTPFILPLADGRILTFWNNTRPMPELDHSTQPHADPSIVEGRSEDFFTNRDAAHVAVSDDCGTTWRGARELYLNGIRNNADFRYVGNPIGSNDKSVHQFQAFELPFNKVLVILGQNEASRRMLIFDVDWLYETGRAEDFYSGLQNVSTQVYLKSEPGHTARNGHCAYNRTNGAVKAPDPIGSRWEVVQISRIDDPRLVSPVQGVVWNFPASREGSVEMELYLAQDAVDISFDDRWTNPCDSVVPELSVFTFHLDRTQLPGSEYHNLRFDYDLGAGNMDLYVDGMFLLKTPAKRNVNIGLSYVNIQCSAPRASEGLYLRNIAKNR